MSRRAAIDPIAARYAEALFHAAKREGQLLETLEQLSLLGRLLREHDGFQHLLMNPDIDPEDKVAVVDRLLKGTWASHVRAFVHLVATMGRSASLPAMADAFEALVDAEQNRLRVIVRCARPLPEPLRARLEAALQRRERKQITLDVELDPSLLGGVHIALDHRVVDGSVQRQLEELRQRLSSVRVH
jgi:F-type H+-transporting ATPase subunit delta